MSPIVAALAGIRSRAHRTSPDMSAREHGFSLVETAIVLMVASVLVIGTGQVLLSTLGAARSMKTSQQATALASQALEEGRDVAYDFLVLSQNALAADARVAADGTIDPDGEGQLAAETLVTAATGGISPHVTQEQVGGVDFTVRRYVTWFTLPSGEPTGYKRLTAIVEWTAGGATRARYASTAVSRTRRGVPMPTFEFLPAEQSRVAQQGNQVVFAHTITNLGITDAYEIEATLPADRTWQVTFHRDVNGDGQLDSSIDTPLLDTNGNGKIDTGPVSSDAVVQLLATWTLPSTEPTGTATVTLAARSAADMTTVATAADTLSVTEPPIDLALHLHNRPRPPAGDTAAQTNLAMDLDGSTVGTLYRYSTDIYNSGEIGGRLLQRSVADAGTTNAGQTANWVFQLSEKKTLRGNATVSLWLANRDLSCSGTAEVRLWLREKPSASTATGTLLSEATVRSDPGTGDTCGWRRVTAQLPVDATIKANRWLELKIAVPTTSASDVLFAYDTTSYDAMVTMPQVLR